VAPNQPRPPSKLVPESLDFRILSIDGGGIRGVIPALFLEQLEALLAEELARVRADPERGSIAELWEGIDDPRIAECFHLIAGTSTGALLTAGLTRPGVEGRPLLSAADAADIYRKHGAEIFHRPFVRNVFDHFDLFWPKYPLEQLRKVVADPDLLGHARLKDACTDVLLPAFDISLPGPAYFTRWGSGDVTMVEAALASAAAPTFFQPAEIGADHFCDGGVYAGNPSLAAIGMALRRTEPPVPTGPRDMLMISLGTGDWVSGLDPGAGGLLGWVSPLHGEPLLEATLGGSGDLADEVAHMLLNGAAPPGYESLSKLPLDALGGGPQLWRYQPPLTGSMSLDAVSSLPALGEVAEEQNQRYSAEMAMLAARLLAAGPVG
jgi:hypothetical protein